MRLISVEEKWPNNKPEIVSEQELFSRGMAIECLGEKTVDGLTPIFCVNILGVHELHFLSQ